LALRGRTATALQRTALDQLRSSDRTASRSRLRRHCDPGPRDTHPRPAVYADF